ncbi:hypothetical protein ABIA22_004715 [Sinorhizobium fredii]
MFAAIDRSAAQPTPAAQRRHVGLDPGLVDEHQPSGIETSLPCLPALTSAGNVGGNLRDLTTRARRGEFSLGPMLMALYRNNNGAKSRVG